MLITVNKYMNLQIPIYNNSSVPHNECFLPRLNSHFLHKTSPLVQFVLHYYLSLINIDLVVLFECNVFHRRYYSVIKVKVITYQLNYIQLDYNI